MSYLSLWDKFLEVRKFWSENRKMLDDFSFFLKEKAELDRFYGKGLERLGKLPLFDRIFGTVSPAFQGLRTLYNESSVFLLDHADYLQEDLYIKLRNIITTQDTLIKEYKQTGKRLVIEREKLVAKHIRCRSKYWKFCKENDTWAAKPNARIIQLEDSYNKTYMESINMLNSFNSVFLEGIKKVLEVYQEHNLEKMKVLREVLQDFVSGEAGNIYSMKMLLDHLPIAIDTFNPEMDQKMFIDSIFTGKNIVDESFVSYSQIMNRISTIEILENHDEEEFLKTINNCWTGVSLTQEEKLHFDKKVKSLEGKKRFIIILNEKRKNGEFFIPENTFNDLGELFNIALNSLQDLETLNMAKQYIILSQTFYTKGSNQEKNYLQALIISNSL